MDAIKAKGARLAVPGIVDLSELAEASSGVAKVVLQGVQDMLLRVALQIARDDFEDRAKPTPSQKASVALGCSYR
ncbi:hypothetical protein ALO49_200167 [Pseudomonas savastanoi pv. retacarpa]|nr:hypothetical protein ALO49_200167 [Pseudomonas savastanoi pv. retacarpa]